MFVGRANFSLIFNHLVDDPSYQPKLKLFKNKISDESE